MSSEMLVDQPDSMDYAMIKLGEETYGSRNEYLALLNQVKSEFKNPVEMIYANNPDAVVTAMRTFGRRELRSTEGVLQFAFLDEDRTYPKGSLQDRVQVLSLTSRANDFDMPGDQNKNTRDAIKYYWFGDVHSQKFKYTQEDIDQRASRAASICQRKLITEISRSKDEIDASLVEFRKDYIDYEKISEEVAIYFKDSVLVNFILKNPTLYTGWEHIFKTASESMKEYVSLSEDQHLEQCRNLAGGAALLDKMVSRWGNPDMSFQHNPFEHLRNSVGNVLVYLENLRNITRKEFVLKYSR